MRAQYADPPRGVSTGGVEDPVADEHRKRRQPAAPRARQRLGERVERQQRGLGREPQLAAGAAPRAAARPHRGARPPRPAPVRAAGGGGGGGGGPPRGRAGPGPAAAGAGGGGGGGGGGPRGAARGRGSDRGRGQWAQF